MDCAVCRKDRGALRLHQRTREEVSVRRALLPDFGHTLSVGHL